MGAVTGVPRPLLFWSGVAMTSLGVVLHFPSFLAMRARHYQMAGMSMAYSPVMVTGMVLLVVGLAVALAGLIERTAGRTTDPEAGRYRVQHGAGDRLSGAHIRLITASSLALVLDVMKPATLAFILPGMRTEYGISVTQSSALPVVALTGTVVGSLGWGYLGDRIGRRATVLMSSLIFIATTVCAMMPTFAWNLVMCFLMGAAAGGLLPVVYALMAESIPTRRRSLVMVLQAGLATTAAYFFTSALAVWLIPALGWRAMWFAHFPLAVLIVLMNRWMPESPRFLIQHGRLAEAKQVIALYGVALVPAGPGQAAVGRASVRVMLGALFGRGGLSRTLVVGGYALAWGGINWGFMTFLPILLKQGSEVEGDSNQILLASSLLAVPGTALVAYCYTRWSSRKTMAAYGLVTVVALALLSVTNLHAGTVPTLGLLMLLIAGTSGVVAMLSPYTAEVYPTRVRSIGSGFAAACSKAGGMFGPPLLAPVIGHFPGMRVVALIVAAPMAVATAAIAICGSETARQDLDDLETAAAMAGVTS